MLTRNAQEFKRFLTSEDISLDFIEQPDGTTLVEIRERLESGGTIRMVIVFPDDNRMVGVYGGDFINGLNPARRTAIYEALNDLNASYTHFKFVLNKERIEIHWAAFTNNNFDPNLVMDIILSMIKTANNEYSNLMRVIWS